MLRRGHHPRSAFRWHLSQRHLRDARQLVKQEQGQEKNGRDGDDAAQHRAGRAEHDVRQHADVLLGVFGDVVPVVQALDRAVLTRIGYGLRQAGRQLVDLGHERHHKRRHDRQKADHEAEKDERGCGAPAQARLQPADQRVERNRQERRCQRPYEHVTHLACQIADKPQRQQADHDLRDRGRADIEGHAALPATDLGQRRLFVHLGGEFGHVRSSGRRRPLPCEARCS